MDGCFDMDMPEGRIKVALARGKRGFAHGAAENCDQMRFFAVVARNLCDGAGVRVPLHVGFAGAVVNDLAWRFAFDPESVGEVS